MIRGTGYSFSMTRAQTRQDPTRRKAKERLPARDDQQHDSGDNRRDTGPARNDRCFLLGDRELERPDLTFVRFLGVVKVPVNQPQKPGDQENSSDYLHAAHVSLPKSTVQSTPASDEGQRRGSGRASRPCSLHGETRGVI